MKRQHYLLLICGALPCFGVYTYYYTGALTSINLTKWAQNGTVSGTSIGLTATTTAGGSLIHRDAVPDSANEYEVKATLRLMNSGGYYVQFQQNGPQPSDPARP